MPHLTTCIFLFFYNGPELGVEIGPGMRMALTPLPSSIGRGSNPRPSDREPSALPLDQGFRPFKTKTIKGTVYKFRPNVGGIEF